MQINNQQLEQLILIFNSLGEIYTKGDDSILLVQCRQTLQKIITDIHASEPIEIKLSQNEDKKE